MIRFAGFDVNVQTARKALTRTVSGFLAALLAKGTTRFTVTLPSVNLGGVVAINLGTLEVDVLDGDIAALRPVGTAHHGVEADFDVTGGLTLTGVSINLFGATLAAPRIHADITVPFVGVDLDVDVTPHGIPDQLVLGLKHVHLRPIKPGNVTPAGLAAPLQFVLAVVTQILSAGISLATTLVPRIPVTVKPMIDAFSKLGIQLHPPSPFITALGVNPDEELVVATDFARVAPAPVGDPTQLASLLSPGENVAVTLNQAVIDQGVDQAMLLGFLPSVFAGGGFTFHVKWMSVALLGSAAAATAAARGGFPAATFTNPATGAPLGAIEVAGELRAKRGSCWCQVKVKIIVDATVWPYIDVTAGVPPPPAPGVALARQTGVHLRMFFDVAATVTLSGYLVMLVDLVFGPILVPLLFLASQVANALIGNFLPYTRTITPAGGTTFTLTASSGTANAFLTWALDFNVSSAVKGQGDLTLDHFTGFRLVDDPTFATLPVPVQDRVDVKVDYAADSLTIEDGVIRLAANLLR